MEEDVYVPYPLWAGRPRQLFLTNLVATGLALRGRVSVDHFRKLRTEAVRQIAPRPACCSLTVSQLDLHRQEGQSFRVFISANRNSAGSSGYTLKPQPGVRELPLARFYQCARVDGHVDLFGLLWNAKFTGILKHFRSETRNLTHVDILVREGAEGGGPRPKGTIIWTALITLPEQ